MNQKIINKLLAVSLIFVGLFVLITSFKQDGLIKYLGIIGGAILVTVEVLFNLKK